MLTTFHAGFADELVKTAGIRDIVKRLVHGKPLPKMGFFEKRRIAKALGVKSRDVERTLMERQGKDRLTKALVAGGGLGAGTVLGGAMDKQSEDMTGAGAGSYAPPLPKTPVVPSDADLTKRRDELLRNRKPFKPATPAPPSMEQMTKRRDELLRNRKPFKPATPAPPSMEQMTKRRDELLRNRKPFKPATPTGPLVAKR
jgi:hypothetical protein